MQRIFKYGDSQNTSLNPDKELNTFMYWPPSYVIIYKGYTLLKVVQFFGPPCRNTNTAIWVAIFLVYVC